MVYEYEGKTEKEAIEKAAQELGLEKDQFDVEILETQKNSLFKKGFVKIRVHTVDTPNHVAPEFEGSVPNATAQATNPKLVANPLPQDEFESKYYNVPDSASDVIGGCGHCEECEELANAELTHANEHHTGHEAEPNCEHRHHVVPEPDQADLASLAQLRAAQRLGLSAKLSERVTTTAERFEHANAVHALFNGGCEVARLILALT